MFIMLIFGLFYSLYIASVYKSFGAEKLGDSVLTWAGSIGAICNGCSRILWATLTDYVGFKRVYFLIMLLQIIVASTIYLVRDNGTLYVIYIGLSFLCEGGHFSCFPAVSAKIFGLKNGATIFTICFIGIPLSSTLSLVLSQMKSTIPEEAIFMIGAVLAALNLVLLYFFDESPI